MCCGWCFLIRSSFMLHRQGYDTIRTSCHREIKTNLENYIRMSQFMRRKALPGVACRRMRGCKYCTCGALRVCSDCSDCLDLSDVLDEIHWVAVGSGCVMAGRPLPWGLNIGAAGLRRAFYLMGGGGLIVHFPVFCGYRRSVPVIIDMKTNK